MNIKSGRLITPGLRCVGWIVLNAEDLVYYETKKQAEKAAKGKSNVGFVLEEMK